MSEAEPEAPAEEAEPAKKQSTTYVVLTKDVDEEAGEETHAWVETGTYAAASAKAAVSAHIKAKGLTEGTFIAVPSRSWAPLTLAVDTRTTVKLT